MVLEREALIRGFQFSVTFANEELGEERTKETEEQGSRRKCVQVFRPRLISKKLFLDPGKLRHLEKRRARATSPLRFFRESTSL